MKNKSLIEHLDWNLNQQDSMNDNYVPKFENFVESGCRIPISVKSDVLLIPSPYRNFNEYSASPDL